MKSSKLALVVVMLAFSMDGVAQEYAFKVLVNKGKNELKSGAGWQQIKVGSSLKAADELRVAENSYIGLVHVTGKPLELKQSGNYKVTDLAARVSGGASVLNKYTDFILSSNTGPRSNLTATGAVDRGVDNIKVYLPRTELAVVYGNEVTISWENDPSLKPYEVVFKSMFGDELNSLETSSNSIIVNLSDRNFENEDNIIVTVYSKSNRSKASDEYTLKKLSKADRERIKSAYSEIAMQTAEQTAFNKFLIAGFYEQNNLLIDAMPYYQEAIKLAPDVQYYKDTYEEFLVRNGIKKPGPKK